MDEAEMDEAEIVEGIALITHDQAAEVAEPGKEALDLPPTAIAAEWSAILGLGAGASSAMGRDHPDAQLGQCGIQWIGIIGTISDEPGGQRGYETGVEGGGNERNLVRRSRGGPDDTRGERKT